MNSIEEWKHDPHTDHKALCLQKTAITNVFESHFYISVDAPLLAVNAELKCKNWDD